MRGWGAAFRILEETIALSISSTELHSLSVTHRRISWALLVR